MKKLRSILSCMLICLFCTCGSSQYTIPFRTYGGCSAHSATYTSWDNGFSVATSDSNYNGSSSWFNLPGGISATSIGGAASLNPSCANIGSNLCQDPFLYGSIASPGLPAVANITSMTFSFDTQQADRSTTGSTP